MILREVIRSFFIKLESEKERRFIISNYKDTKDPEIREIIDYVKENGLKVFNYKWADSIAKSEPQIIYESKKDLYYQIIGEDRLYLKRGHNTDIRRKNCCRARMRDQYESSPHRYGNYVEGIEWDVVIDVGAAEGNFALEYINKAKKVIIIETDSEWIEALNNTFEKYKDKICIINKYLSDIDDDNNITFDTLLRKNIVNLNDRVVIKMDIEGAEEKALIGGRNYLEGIKNGMVIACTYHCQNAYENVTKILKSCGYKTEHSSGYMYFPKRYERKLFPEKRKFESFLRRGLVIGTKGVLKSNTDELEM